MVYLYKAYCIQRTVTKGKDRTTNGINSGGEDRRQPRQQTSPLFGRYIDGDDIDDARRRCILS